MVANMFVSLIYLGAVVSLSLANDPAVCSEPLNEGSGDENTLMYYYDKDAGTCLSFYYKGQDGNGNQFTSGNECMQTCIPEHAIDPAVCSELMNEGSGDGKNLMYFYVKDMDLCQPFFYKGQEGNGNKFTSDRKCMQTCSSKFSQLYPATEDEVCNLPVDHGSCMAMLLMYHYNAEEKNCRIFHYGGCQGNGNRFETREECQAKCMAKQGRSGVITNPDEATTDAGLIVGILGGIIFAVSVIVGIVFLLKERKEKAKRKGRKQNPDDGTEMSPAIGTL